MRFINTKNYKIFNHFCNVKMALFSALLFTSSFVLSSELNGIDYNTIHNDQIQLVFSFSENINSHPQVRTSMIPAFIEITFDATDFDYGLSNTLVSHAGVKNIKVTSRNDKVITMINLEFLSIFDVAIKENEFVVTLNYGQAAEIIEEFSSIGGQYINNIESIDFRRGPENEGLLLVNLNKSMVAVDVNNRLGKVYIEFHNTQIVEDLLYKLDVTDFGTIITGVETFKDGRNARLVVDVDKNFTFSHKQDKNIFTLTVDEVAEEVPGYLSGTDEFTGRKLVLDFQDIPVRTVLQIIAEFNEFNLITSDTVTGNITLRLDGVPWDQALDIILKVKGLDKRMDGNILMVAPSDELAAREAKVLQAQQQFEQLTPLYSEYIQINYAKATDFANLIKNDDTSILSARGSVSVDERTNTLLLRDTVKSIENIKRMISILDIAVRQVVIEARMVTVKDNVGEELGIRWGVTSTDNEYSTSGSLAGAASANAGVAPAITDRLNVNLPVVNPAASLAFQVARLADGKILDLELSALEKENKGEIIASPRITTANQKEAYIEQGVEIPYQQASSSGATAVQFKKAVLSLTVTPHITPDDKIILDLVVTQDTVSSLSNGLAPAIDTQRIGTQVLVNNGETIVLGGIYQQSIISTISKVPILGDIPYLGWVFRNTNNFNEKKELLIFVTPRIVTEHF